MVDRMPIPPTDVADDSRVRLHRAGAVGSRTHAIGCGVAALLAMIPPILYFGFFAVLIVDELILGTRYLSPGNLPAGAGDWLETIYSPLILLTRYILRID